MSLALPPLCGCTDGAGLLASRPLHPRPSPCSRTIPHRVHGEGARLCCFASEPFLPLKHIEESRLGRPLGCHGNRAFLLSPLLFTLVRACGRKQPVAEGEGGRGGGGQAAALNQIIPARSGSPLHSREALNEAWAVDGGPGPWMSAGVPLPPGPPRRGLGAGLASCSLLGAPAQACSCPGPGHPRAAAPQPGPPIRGPRGLCALPAQPEARGRFVLSGFRLPTSSCS